MSKIRMFDKIILMYEHNVCKALDLCEQLIFMVNTKEYFWKTDELHEIEKNLKSLGVIQHRLNRFKHRINRIGDDTKVCEMIINDHYKHYYKYGPQDDEDK